MDKKYEKIIEVLDSTYGTPIVDMFDEELTKTILKLEDESNTSKYNNRDWDMLFKIAEETESPALFISLFNCPYLPESYFIKLFEITPPDCEIFPLFSEYVPDYVIDKIYNINIFTFDEILLEAGGAFSQKTMHYLCNLPESDLKNLKYLPFRFINPDEKMSSKIRHMMKEKSENTYIEKIDESFFTEIINNENIYEVIRNDAFNEKYNPADIVAETEYITNELYKLYADTIFELEPAPENEDLIRQASIKISNKAMAGKLPESFQIDFLNRALLNQDKCEHVVADIAYYTKSQEVLELAAFHKSSIVRDSVLTNAKYVDKNVMTELVRSSSIYNLTKCYITAIMYNEFSYNIHDLFIDKGDEYIHRAILSSMNSFVDNSVLSSTMRRPYYNELKYIYEFKSILELFPKEQSQKFLSYLSDLLLEENMRKETGIIKNRTALKDALHSVDPNKWDALTTAEHTVLMEKINVLKKKFPQFDNQTIILENKIQETYRASEIVLKYPKIFDRNKYEPHPKTTYHPHLTDVRHIPCHHINVEEIYKLSNDDLEQFKNDILKFEKASMLSEINTAITNACDLHHSEQALTFKRIYKLTDLYNTIDEKIQDLEFSLSQWEVEEER